MIRNAFPGASSVRTWVERGKHQDRQAKTGYSNPAVAEVRAPTLLIVGDRNTVIIENAASPRQWRRTRQREAGGLSAFCHCSRRAIS